MPFPNAETLTVLVEALGPAGLILLFLFYLLRRPAPPTPPDDGFSAEQKLWLKEQFDEVKRAIADLKSG